MAARDGIRSEVIGRSLIGERATTAAERFSFVWIVAMLDSWRANPILKHTASRCIRDVYLYGKYSQLRRKQNNSMLHNEISPPGNHYVDWKAAALIFGVLLIWTWIVISHHLDAPYSY